MSRKNRVLFFVVLLGVLIAFAPQQSTLAQTRDQELSLLAERSWDAKRYDQAHSYIKQAQAINPRFAEYHHLEALILSGWILDDVAAGNPMPLGRYEAALGAYERALELLERRGEPLSLLVEIRTEKADLAWAVGDRKNSLLESLHIVNMDPTSPATNYRAGLEYLHQYSMTQNENTKGLIMYFFERAVLNNRRAEYWIPYAYLFVGMDRFEQNSLREAETYLKLWTIQINEVEDGLYETEEMWMKVAETALNEIESRKPY